MTPRQLSSKLADFGIKSKDIRIGATNKKGYDMADFADPFRRYLSSGCPASAETTRQPKSGAASSSFQSATASSPVADSNSPQALNSLGCHGVAHLSQVWDERDMEVI
ncbi:hypothetical protein D3C84_946750 [compost metagenome]